MAEARPRKSPRSALPSRSARNRNNSGPDRTRAAPAPWPVPWFGARLALLRTKERARAQVRRAYDLGLNYFDCAHSYWEGHSEETYGDVLPPFRKNIFLTTKCLKRTKKDAEAELQLSLAALKTDYLD